jgi:4-hydroxy-tetrahydrodipicolinate reductase
MGQALIEATLAADDLSLQSAFDIEGGAAVGRDVGERHGRTTGVVVGSDVDAALRDADVLIDFTCPEGTLAHLAACVRHALARWWVPRALAIRSNGSWRRLRSGFRSFSRPT